MMFDGRTQWSHAPVLSSAYPVRPGEDDCLFYMKNHLCEWEASVVTIILLYKWERKHYLN